MNILPHDLRALYPFRHHFLELRGQRMHYVDEGQGHPLVFLHGNPTWSFYFRDLIKAFRETHRVIAPDHIGCGLSDKPKRYPYTLATHIGNLEQLLDHLGVETATLAVHDWGGPIGFGWAARHPQRVRSLIVFNSAAYLRGPMPFRIRICRWPLVGDIALRVFNAFPRAATSMACHRRERMTPAVRKAYLFPFSRMADRTAVLRFVRDIPERPRHPSYGVLQKIEESLPGFRSRPMIIFWGGRDFCFNDWYLKTWTIRFPQAEVHRFPDAGHFVVEDAGEQIIPLLRAFLSREPA